MFDRVNAYASDASKMDFRDRLDELMEDPLPGDGDIYPYKDGTQADSFTASFGDGLLVYQVVDAPPARLIRLWDVLLY